MDRHRAKSRTALLPPLRRLNFNRQRFWPQLANQLPQIFPSELNLGNGRCLNHVGKHFDRLWGKLMKSAVFVNFLFPRSSPINFERGLGKEHPSAATLALADLVEAQLKQCLRRRPALFRKGCCIVESMLVDELPYGGPVLKGLTVSCHLLQFLQLWLYNLRFQILGKVILQAMERRFQCGSMPTLLTSPMTGPTTICQESC